MRNALLILPALLLFACQQTGSEQYSPSDYLPPYQIAHFPDYQTATQNWLLAHRVAVSEDLEWEVELNSPFECRPQKQEKAGILLLHGLGDSPYFFRDIGFDLCKQGYWVRTLLLPGHGSKPGDMLNASYHKWKATVDFHVDTFANEVDTLVLGGFSTGANLATIAAFERVDIAGLLLFSPAFESSFAHTWIAPYATWIYPWPNKEPEDNPTRYNSMAMQGFAAYQNSVDVLADHFDEGELATPVFMVVAEEDSVVDVERVADYFVNEFTATPKHLIWLGENKPEAEDMEQWTMSLPDASIGAASHMSVLFKPDNPLYGINGTIRICDNGQSQDQTSQCLEGESVWYGPWGKTEEGKVYARLTYNPWYDKMRQRLNAFLSTSLAK